ncbi:hypothetical protein CEXT_464371 [Caerostris extrusa]|uniref:Uncharacterized protein n=1 Tax=Caerostris extrusa TaxID=172846 RepID=A0AAV4SSQ2_CAEEX|nr:hypothetical protein CEXT_464371 [Caerostris extrusa]
MPMKKIESKTWNKFLKIRFDELNEDYDAEANENANQEAALCSFVIRSGGCSRGLSPNQHIQQKVEIVLIALAACHF